MQQHLLTSTDSGASNGTAAGTAVIYKAYHIVKDVVIPSSSTLKIVSGQKIILNANDKVYAYASAANVDLSLVFYKRYLKNIYIGAQVENRVSPKFLKEDFTGTGSTTNFTLTNEVPGGSSQNIMVIVNNVVQEPDVAYTINDDASNLPKVLTFTGTPANGDSIYVIA